VKCSLPARATSCDALARKLIHHLSLTRKDYDSRGACFIIIWVDELLDGVDGDKTLLPLAGAIKKLAVSAPKSSPSPS
jgi:hypothetical protein